MASPQTIIRDGSGAQAASYQLPPGLFQYVESILVQIDNTGGGDIRPTLQVQTVNGVVMAAKRQGETIPAGDTGTATWALRLTDEGGGSSTLTSKYGSYLAFQQTIPTGVSTAFAFSQLSGDALLDVSTPAAPTFVAAGIYIVTASTEESHGTQQPGTLTDFELFFGANAAAFDALAFTGFVPVQGVGPPKGSLTLPVPASAGLRLTAHIAHNAGVNSDYDCGLNVLKIGS